MKKGDFVTIDLSKVNKRDVKKHLTSMIFIVTRVFDDSAEIVTVVNKHKDTAYFINKEVIKKVNGKYLKILYK